MLILIESNNIFRVQIQGSYNPVLKNRKAGKKLITGFPAIRKTSPNSAPPEFRASEVLFHLGGSHSSRVPSWRRKKQDVEDTFPFVVV